MAKKGKFIKPMKTAVKEAPEVVAKSVLRTGFVGGGLYLNKTLTTVDPDKGKAMMSAKLSGGLMTLVGLAGEVFLGNDYLASAAGGLTTAGMLVSAKEWVLKDKAADFGLAGLGEPAPPAMAPIPSSVMDFDIEDLEPDGYDLDDIPEAEYVDDGIAGPEDDMNPADMM